MLDGRPHGYMPAKLRFQPPASWNDGKCITTPRAEARWASGTKKTLLPLQVCPKGGLNIVRVFDRPDVPGRAEDARFALDLERNSALRRTASAGEESNRQGNYWIIQDLVTPKK